MFSLFAKKNGGSDLTGIGIDPDGVCLATVSHAPGRRPRLTACDFRPLDGAAEGRARLLARVSAEHRLKRARCATVLNEEDYKLLLTAAPDVPAQELRAALRWRIKDLIDFHINDATIDVFDLPVEQARGTPREMYVVAARNQAIQQRVECLQEAGISLDVVDIRELCQRNVAALLPEDANGVVLLSLQARTGLLTLTRQGLLYLARPLAVGLEALRRDETRDDCLGQIALEVQRSLDYYESHFRQPPIRHLVVAPLGEPVHGLTDHLAGNLNTQVAELDMRAIVECDRTIPPEWQARCLPALGAALRQEVRAL